MPTTTGRPPTGLVGRKPESEALARLVAALREGVGGVLVVRGEPGIGKSALLNGLRPGSPVRLLRISGVEYEAEIALAGLHQVCAPLLRDLDGGPPAPHRDVLRAAFDAEDTGPPDPFRLSLAVLRLLTDTAAEQPLLCVIDDAQWLDGASARALAFAARRLRGSPLALVLALRPDPARPEFTGLPELALAGLSREAARSLLTSRVRAPLDTPVSDRILAEARGNPLALLALPRTAEMAGGFGLPDTGPWHGGGEDVLRQIERLPRDTRLLLLTAAAEPTGEPPLLWRAARRLGVGATAATPAEDRGLVRFGTRVRFAYPLMRNAIYHAAPAADRRAVHSALAALLDGADEDDRQVWHRSQATVGPDEELAAALDHSTGRAVERGGVAAEAAFLTESVRLTLEPRSRAVRALRAAQANRDIGAVQSALGLLTLAEAGSLDVLPRARAETLRARIAIDTRSDLTAFAALRHVAERVAPVDDGAAREISLQAIRGALFAGRAAGATQLLAMAEAARTVIGEAPSARPLDLLHAGLATHITSGFVSAAPVMRRAVDAYLRGRASREHTPDEWGLACRTAIDLWDDAAWRSLADRQLWCSRTTGALSSIPMALSYRALAHVHAGEFDAASALVDEGYATAADAGLPGPVQSELALAVWRGDEERTERLVDAASRDATRRNEGRLVTITEHARAVLFNALGRYPEALRVCRPAYELDEIGFQAWLPGEFIEAAVRSGRHDLAAPAVERLAERTAASPTAWATGTELRSRALVARGREADELYREAVERLERGEGRVHAARARLVHGEWLRREGRRTEARAQLRAAHEVFVEIGAAAFAARAGRELGATGEFPRKRGAVDPYRLTDQERRIARLVITGATSKEVGSQLFLSPRTVDSHLRNIFRKLGITSRRQLVGSLPPP